MMIEVYLFINPLDKSNLIIEQKYLNIIAKEKEKIHFKIVPFLNPKVFNKFLLANSISIHDLKRRNQLFSSIYSACLDCKAVQLQGTPLARKFLFELQKRLDFKDNVYSKELVHSILEDINVDMTLFFHDRKSNLIVDFFKLDLQMANEMGVEDFSDSVIFNYNCDRDFGVLVKKETPEDLVQDLFKTECANNRFTNPTDDSLHLYKKG